ncbi:MAG TPA: cell division protein FtsQ/DivIB [Gammaproteobacteria bacterium]|nr:cell division protein FtsQ/DivIB [Gammaproteobacteria bacterium]
MPAPPSSRRVWKWLGPATAGAALLLVLVLLAMRFATPLLNGPALTTLIVQGELHHVMPAEVRTALLPAVAGRGFFRVDMPRARARVQALPWVAGVTVRRGWPHTLYVQVVEEVPVARWNGSGLMDAQGKVFVRGDVSGFAQLPLLSGPEDGAGDVLADYHTFVALTEPRGLRITQLTVDERGAASVRFSDGIEVRLGREDASQRLARFGAVALPALGAQLPNVAYVDMRYTNGFAVGWRETAPACSMRATCTPAHRRDGHGEG